MDNTVRIDVEGQVITLPLKYDPHARRWLESYWPVIAHPPWTPAGRPIMLVLDDPCAHAEMRPRRGSEQRMRQLPLFPTCRRQPAGRLPQR